MPHALIVSTFVLAVNPLSRWDVPDECPARDAVERRMAQEQIDRPRSNLNVAVAISHDPSGYRLRGEIEFAGRAQPIWLSHRNSCVALVEKFFLYIVPLLPDPETASPPVAPPPPTVARRFGAYLRAAGEFDAGTLRVCGAQGCSDLLPTGGGSIAGGWNHRRLRVELGVPLHSRVSTAEATGDFGRVDSRWLRTGLQLRVCGALERRRFELLLCGELGLQMLFGLPRSDDSNFTPATPRPMIPWASARLGLAAVWWAHPRLGLRFDVAPGVHVRPKEPQVHDRITDSDLQRSLVSIGLLHTVFALGLDVRLGERRSRRD